jgi:hypothetical protein
MPSWLVVLPSRDGRPGEAKKTVNTWHHPHDGVPGFSETGRFLLLF